MSFPNSSFSQVWVTPDNLSQYLKVSTESFGLSQDLFPKENQEEDLFPQEDLKPQNDDVFGHLHYLARQEAYAKFHRQFCGCSPPVEDRLLKPLDFEPIFTESLIECELFRMDLQTIECNVKDIAFKNIDLTKVQEHLDKLTGIVPYNLKHLDLKTILFLTPHKENKNIESILTYM